MGQSMLNPGSPPGRPPVERLTARRLLRQLALIALVILVWSALLAGYLALIGPSAETPLSQLPPPAEAPAATVPPAAPPTPTPAPATPAETPTEAPPAATPAPTEAPAVTPLPTEAPADTPLPTEPPAEPAVSFAGDVLPIFQSRCVQCHGATRSSGGQRLDSYQAVMAGSRSGPSVVPGDAEDSSLVRLIVAGRMPPGADNLSPAQIQTITDWINAGALDTP